MYMSRQSLFPNPGASAYSARAARMRRAADADRYLAIRDVLLRLAATYDDLAARCVEFEPVDEDSRIVFPRCGAAVRRMSR